MLGREENVRVDAQVFSDRLSSSSTVRVIYEIFNERPVPIALAELNPDASYDPETREITVTLGTEVPGNEFLPRLVKIAPGEKKAFTVGVRMPIVQSSFTPLAAVPRFLRVKLHFLGEVAPFETLIGIPERAIHDRRLADQLFTTWVESTESVVTNAIPIEWVTATSGFDASVGGSTTGRPRRRGRG